MPNILFELPPEAGDLKEWKKVPAKGRGVVRKGLHATIVGNVCTIDRRKYVWHVPINKTIDGDHTPRYDLAGWQSTYGELMPEHHYELLKTLRPERVVLRLDYLGVRAARRAIAQAAQGIWAESSV